MAPTARGLILAVNIFLLLSVHPIEAKRTVAVKTALGTISARTSQVQKAMRDLEQTIQSDSSLTSRAAAGVVSGRARRTWRGVGHLASRAHARGWWCQRKRESFERKASKLAMLVAKSAPKPGEARKASFTETAYTLLQMRAVAKTLDSAKWWGCDWANKADYQTKAFEDIVAMGSLENPCFVKVKQMLQTVEGKSEAEQNHVFGEAMAVMLSQSDTCHPVQVVLNDTEAEDEHEMEKEAEEAAESLAKKMGDPSAAAVSLLDDDGGISPSLSPGLLETASLAQQVEREWESRRVLLGTRFLDVAIFVVLAFLAMLMLILVCTAAVTMIFIVLGVVFCIIRSIILRIVSLFKDMGKVSVSGCVSVLWRQTVGWGNKDDDNSKYFFTKGAGKKIFGVACAVPIVAAALSASPAMAAVILGG